MAFFCYNTLMTDINRQALNLHKRWGGKLGITGKTPLKNKRDLALAYTPGVAEICRQIFKKPFLANGLTIKKNCIAVVTDGSAVLGLGNLGPLAALPVMEGKCVLFKKLAGVDAFPICLDTQNVDEIIRAIKLIAPVFGGINLEDISAPRCFEIEKRLQKELDIPVLHDDQHGTATVVLAALINSLKLKKLPKQQARIVINGAGAAGIAVAKLLIKYGIKNLIMCDSSGIIHKNRPKLPLHKKQLAKLTNPEGKKGGLEDALKNADVFVGVSAKGALKPKMLKYMSPKPVIFALANPDPEILPPLAKKAGAFIVATGRSDFPNQINNVLVFPGIFRGALDNRVKKITSAMLISAAVKLSGYVKNLSPKRILPDALDKRAARSVASAIQNY